MKQGNKPLEYANRRSLTYTKLLEQIARDGIDHIKVLSAFMRFGACVMCGPDLRHQQWYQAVCARVPSAHRMLRVPHREEQYIAEAKLWKKEHLVLFGQAFGAMVLDAENNLYDDVLGRVYMEWSGSGAKKHGGEFYTPIELCYMMAKFTLSETSFEKPEPEALMDNACGSGNMMLGSIRVMHEDLGLPSTRCQWWLQDISSIACDMAFINCCLYGVPAVVVRGNSLVDEIREYHYTPWYPVAHGTLNPVLEQVETQEPSVPTIPAKPNKKLERILHSQNPLFSLGEK